MKEIPLWKNIVRQNMETHGRNDQTSGRTENQDDKTNVKHRTGQNSTAETRQKREGTGRSKRRINPRKKQLSICRMCVQRRRWQPHSSTLAWKIPWTEEPGGLQPMGLLRVGHSWATSLSLFTFMHWRRKWQPTPVFLPGESQGRGSLVGCHLWGRTESDTTEAT